MLLMRSGVISKASGSLLWLPQLGTIPPLLRTSIMVYARQSIAESARGYQDRLEGRRNDDEWEEIGKCC